MPTRRSCIAVCVFALVFALAGCSHGRSATATANDRAACTRLEAAYAALNAWNGGPQPTAQYQEAIAAASRADNARLSDAISDWMTAVLRSARARPGSDDVAYATEECRQIGLPLRLDYQPPKPASPSHSPSTADSDGSDGGDD